MAVLSVDPGVAGGEDHIAETFELGLEFENGIRAALAGAGILTLVFE